jgi:demethylmenaquinone methyltransferase/2-methoxy-6-polyprenyl-1,4-benzoquinol methylase
MTQTHFGFESVDEKEKAQRVAGVFSSVAQKYDVMNDLMSMGLHRLWKKFAIDLAAPRPGERVLDVAGGTADLSSAFARRVGPFEKTGGQVWLTDINNAMLGVGRDRLLDEGVLAPVAQCDAEKLPFPDNHFDIVTVAFGLRNMTHKDRALAEMRRVLRPGGRLLVLEFSRVWKPLEKAYDAVFVQAAALAGPKNRRGRRFLPLSGRIDPHASGPGRAQGPDGTSRAGTCRSVQHDGRRRRAASRLQALTRRRDMKRLLIAAFAAVVGLGLMVPEAEAKRLGGGKSASACSIRQRRRPRHRPQPANRQPLRLPLPHLLLPPSRQA